jgi:hypothetical protein
MEFISKIKDKSPGYDPLYDDLVESFTLQQGGKTGTSSETSVFQQGRFFYNTYEIFIYAALLGLKSDYRIPISPSAKRTTFMAMKNWLHTDITDFLIMSVLSKANLDYLKLEQMDDKDIETEVTKIRILIEEYANGGFDKIRGKRESDPLFFNGNDNCFIDLLDSSI